MTKMGFSLSPQGSPGVKGSRGHRGEEGEPVSFCDSLPSTFFPFPLKKLYFPQGIVGFCLYAFCSLRGGVGCFFPPSLFLHHEGLAESTCRGKKGAESLTLCLARFWGAARNWALSLCPCIG